MMRSLKSIPKLIITGRSTLIQQLCSESSHGDECKPIKLEEENPDTFDIYMTYVYYKKIEVGDINDALPNEVDALPKTCIHWRLQYSYLLAERLGDLRLLIAFSTQSLTMLEMKSSCLLRNISLSCGMGLHMHRS
jgi:hypothetical protein